MKQKRKQEYICDWCKKKYIRYPFERRGKHKFCSMECRVAFTDANKINTHFPLKCDNCGKAIEVYQWGIDHFKHHFCSAKCQYDFLSGEGNPNYGKPLCQETIDKISATKKKNYKKENHPLWGKHHSDEAKEKMRIAHSDPSAHPNWQGGVSLLEFEEAYGIEMKEWRNIAKKVRERDSYTCQYCGAAPSTSVHHIQPRRYGIDNSMENLITLCASCHPKIENKTKKLIDQGIEPITIFYEVWSQ